MLCTCGGVGARGVGQTQNTEIITGLLCQEGERERDVDVLQTFWRVFVWQTLCLHILNSLINFLISVSDALVGN